ncbi:MAG: hypothetical protein ACI35S_02030 [Anaeroplasma sp.]
MNKKIIYLVVAILIFISIMFIFNGKNTDVAVDDDTNDTSYYVEADNNIFVRVAKLFDEICSYIINLVLNGIESIFSVILGN